MAMTALEAHNELLKKIPEGISHDRAKCPWCLGVSTAETASLKNDSTSSQEGGAMGDPKTYTEEELQASVAAAVAKIQSELAELRDTRAVETLKAEVEKAVAEAIAAKDTEITDLQSKLDTAVLEGEKAKTDHASLVELLETTKAEQDRQAEIAARRDERLTKVREVASFPEEYLTANADRWAAMDDDAFAGIVADYAAVSNKSTEGIPRETAMSTERKPAAVKTTGDRLSATREVLDASLRGVDFSTISHLA